MPWDPEAATKHLWQSAGKKSSHYCARYTANAINAGLGGHIPMANAKDFGPNLVDAGFTAMPAGTVPQSGDIIIFPGFDKDLEKKVKKDHKWGHMEMYDGTHKMWVSDFKQQGDDEGIYPGADYRNSGVQYTLYRYGQ